MFFLSVYKCALVQFSSLLSLESSVYYVEFGHLCVNFFDVRCGQESVELWKEA